MINSIITRVTGKITEWIKNIYLIGYDGLRMTMNVGGRKKKEFSPQHFYMYIIWEKLLNVR